MTKSTTDKILNTLFGKYIVANQRILNLLKIIQPIYYY